MWEYATLFDHVPIMLQLSEDRMNQKVLRAGTPVAIKLSGHRYATHEKMTKEQRADTAKHAEESFERIWAHVDNEFQAAISSWNVNEASRLWSLAAELWLYLGQILPGQPDGPDVDIFTRRAIPRRGTSMPLRQEDLIRTAVEGSDAALLDIPESIQQLAAMVSGA